MDTSLKGKVAVVTGAAREISAAIARHFANEGCSVYIADIDSDGARECAAKLGDRAQHVRLDVTDRREVRAVLEGIDRSAGGIDVLVNNAGVMATGPALAMPDEVWDDLLSVNLTGIFNCVQTAAPAMIARRRGVIINIASVSAFRGGGTFGNVWYGATKAAVVALTKGLARELGPHGVRVNAIAPSVVETEMVAAKVTPEIRGEILTKFPLGRLAKTDDVAGMAVFLASDLASFITGETVAVDGGLTKV